jgi:hypothetical protein
MIFLMDIFSSERVSRNSRFRRWHGYIMSSGSKVPFGEAKELFWHLSTRKRLPEVSRRKT